MRTTRDIRASRTAIARHALGTAAVAVALFVPVTPGTQSGTASLSARPPGSAAVLGSAAPAPVSVSTARKDRETGCCA